MFQVFQTSPLAICTSGKRTEQPMLLLGNICMAAFPMTGLENWIWKSFFLHFQGLALCIWLCPISSLYHAPTALPSHLPMPTTAVIAVPFLFQQPARTGSPCSWKKSCKTPAPCLGEGLDSAYSSTQLQIPFRLRSKTLLGFFQPFPGTATCREENCCYSLCFSQPLPNLPRLQIDSA